MADFTGNDLANLINGTAGDDLIVGYDGNDTLNGNGGFDRIYGGSGNDLLNGGTGDEFLDGGVGNDMINAGSRHDVLRGREGNDLLNAGVGNDILEGGNGNDILNAGEGNDILEGEGGNDILNGGWGSDLFLFNTILGKAGVDIIIDFNISTNDKIVLDKKVFSALETKAVVSDPLLKFEHNPLMAADFSVINVRAGIETFVAAIQQNEIVYNRLTGSLFYNPNNNILYSVFGAGRGKFATIVGSPDNLSNTDFHVGSIPLTES
jgi:Ca2+-binding RTX toxin-like protein